MASILVTRFPEKGPELWAYQATIVKAARNYEGSPWVAYDRQFRRQALVRKDLNWSVIDSRLYNEAFTGRAKHITRCRHCLSDSNTTQQCPDNPNLFTGWHPDMRQLPQQLMPSLAWDQGPARTSSTRQEICRNYNDGRCKFQRCRFQHICKECSVPHPWITYPHNAARTAGRSRSPVRQTRQLPAQPQALPPRF